MSDSNYSVNIGVLQTAHSIFVPWRSATRSDALFTSINYVLSRFGRPFLQLFEHTTRLLLSNPTNTAPNSTLEMISQAQVSLVDIYYDLTCQDLPPDFEDTHAQFFGPPSGLLLQLLAWDPEVLRGDVSSFHYRRQVC